MNFIENELFKTLEKKYEQKIQECKSILMIYFEKSVGIGDHSNHLEEMNKLITEMTEANDNLKMLHKTFGLMYGKL